MGTQEKQQARSGWDVARIVIGLGNILWAGLIALIVGSLFLQAFSSITVAVLHGVTFVAVVAQIFAGVGLVRDRGWAGRVLLAAAAGLLLSLGITAAVVGQLWLLTPALPALFSVGFLALPQFDVKLARGGEDLGIRPLHVFLVIGGLAVLYLVAAEAEDISGELRVHQHQSECEDGDVGACRQAALLELSQAEEFDHMREIEKRFAPLCEKGHAPACRSLGYVRSDYFANLGPQHSVILAKLREIAPTACVDGDGRACAVTAWFDPDARDEILPKAEELCRGGDGDACLVWVKIAGEQKDTNASPTEMYEVACKAGVTHLCETTADPRARCLRGELDACAGVAAAAGPSLGALAKAHRKFGNPGLYGFVPPGADHRAACDGGDSIACLFEGLKLVGDVPKPPDENEPLPERAALDATLGRACDGGVALACLTYGFRLLDRSPAEKRDIKRANGWLKKGCELGSEAACREVSLEPQLLEYDYEAYREQMARACMKVGDPFDCDAYVSLLAFDIGASPWPISDDIAYVHLRRACTQTRDPMACANAAFMIQGREVTPEYQLTALALGRAACGQRYAEGCQTMFWSADRWWPEHADALREKICAQVPTACQTHE